MAGQSRAPAEAEDIQNNSCQGTRRALRQYLQKPLRGLGHAGMAAARRGVARESGINAQS